MLWLNDTVLAPEFPAPRSFLEGFLHDAAPRRRHLLLLLHPSAPCSSFRPLKKQLPRPFVLSLPVGFFCFQYCAESVGREKFRVRHPPPQRLRWQSSLALFRLLSLIVGIYGLPFLVAAGCEFLHRCDVARKRGGLLKVTEKRAASSVHFPSGAATWRDSQLCVWRLLQLNEVSFFPQ